MVKKGQSRRVWTPEQKAEIVYKHLNEVSAQYAGMPYPRIS